MIVLGILLTLAGLVLIAAFVFSRARCRTRVEATVSQILVDKIPMRGGTYIKQYTPMFTYSVNGKTYSEKSDTTTTKSNKFAVGQTVSILVDPDYPEAMRYGSNVGILLAGLVFALIGIFIIILFFM